MSQIEILSLQLRSFKLIAIGSLIRAEYNSVPTNVRRMDLFHRNPKSREHVHDCYQTNLRPTSPSVQCRQNFLKRFGSCQSFENEALSNCSELV